MPHIPGHPAASPLTGEPTPMTPAEIAERAELKKQFPDGIPQLPPDGPMVPGPDDPQTPPVFPAPPGPPGPGPDGPIQPGGFGATNDPIINAFDSAGEISGGRGFGQPDVGPTSRRARPRSVRRGKGPASPQTLNPNATQKPLNPKARFKNSAQVGTEVENIKLDPSNPEDSKTIINTLNHRGFAPGQDPRIGMMATQMAIRRMGMRVRDLQPSSIPESLAPQTSNLGIPGQGVNNFLQRLRRPQPNVNPILGALRGGQ